MKRTSVLAAAALLLGLAPALRADPVPSAAAGSAAAPAPHPPTPRELQERIEELQRRAASLSSALPKPASSAAAAPSGSSGVASPADALRDELARKWAELAATRLERREQHRAALLKEAGQSLSDPQVKAELKLHATHLADIARMEFLAQNARKGAERDKLLVRIARLSAREQARHRQRMTRLLAAPPSTPSAAASVAPSPAPSSGGPR